MTAPDLPGLHHVTAIAGDARRNRDFYTRVLGLRLVKRTVNFDDPGTYHLYYGDERGSPGSLLTFFPWAGLPRGRPGHGQVCATAFSVPPASLRFWTARLLAHGVTPAESVRRFGDEVLAFTDPDGLVLELVAAGAPDPRPAPPHPEIPAALGIRGLFGVTIAVIDAPRTLAVLAGPMGWRAAGTEGARTRLTAATPAPGARVDLLSDRSLPRGRPGPGTVHHLAFRTPTDASQAAAGAALAAAGLPVSPVLDRSYFHSIYFREPEGVLFEVATDLPGFATDESPGSLGTTLRLPPRHESQRAAIEAALPPLE